MAEFSRTGVRFPPPPTDSNIIHFNLPTKSGHLDPNSLMKQIRQRGYGRDKVTIHGFRSSFMTICEEEEIETNIAITEMAVNHAVKGALGDTYRRGTFLKQRKKLMQDWSNYIDELKRNHIKEKVIKSI